MRETSLPSRSCQGHWRMTAACGDQHEKRQLPPASLRNSRWGRWLQHPCLGFHTISAWLSDAHWEPRRTSQAGSAPSQVSGLPEETGLFWHLPPLSWSPSSPAALHSGTNSVLLHPPGTLGSGAGGGQESSLLPLSRVSPSLGLP